MVDPHTHAGENLWQVGRKNNNTISVALLLSDFLRVTDNMIADYLPSAHLLSSCLR